MVTGRVGRPSPYIAGSPAQANEAPLQFVIGAADSAALTSLRTGSALQKRIAATVDRATTVYAPLISAGARVVVLKSQGNGGEPVVAIQAKGFDPSKPARIWTHFHGFMTTAAAPLESKAGITKSIIERFKTDAQTIFVLPESQAAPQNANGSPGATDWSNVRNVDRTVSEALQALRVSGGLPTAERVVSAHSAGGRAFGFVMQNLPDGSGLRADRIEMLDCAYNLPDAETETGLAATDAIAQWAQTANGAKAKTVRYVKSANGDNGRPPDDAFRALYGVRYRELSMTEHNETVAKTFGRDL